MVNMFSFHHFLKFGRVFYSKREKHGSISRTATGCQAHKTFDKTAFLTNQIQQQTNRDLITCSFPHPGKVACFMVSSHWLLATSSSVLIGYCDYLSFGLTTLNRNAPKMNCPIDNTPVRPPNRYNSQGTLLTLTVAPIG